MKYLELSYTRVSSVMETSFRKNSLFPKSSLVSPQIPNFCAKNARKFRQKSGNPRKNGFNATKQIRKYWTKNTYVYIIYLNVYTWGLALPPNPMVTTARTVVAPSWVLAGVSWPFSVFTYKEYTSCSLLNYTLCKAMTQPNN